MEEGASGGAVVGVEDEVVLTGFLEDGLMTRPAPVGGGGGDDDGAAAAGEGFAGFIEIGSCDLAGAAHHAVVSAVGGAAAAVVGDEEVPPVIVADNERGFDGAADGLFARAATERVNRGV